MKKSMESEVKKFSGQKFLELEFQVYFMPESSLNQRWAILVMCQVVKKKMTSKCQVNGFK